MADTKISALSAGTAAPGDEIPVNRGGSNFKITAGDILKINGGTITANSPVLDLTQTWNNAAVTFTGLKFNVPTDSSAAGSLLMDLQVGGASQFNVSKSGTITVPAGGSSTFGIRSASAGMSYFGTEHNFVTSSGSWNVRVASNGFQVLGNAQILFGPGNSGTDTVFLRDNAANILAQRNGTNAQTFRVYNTYTDASNYERGKISWSSNVLQIGTEKAGTGTARALELQTDGTTRVTIGTSGYILTTSGAILSGAGIFANANNVFAWDNNRSTIRSSADGLIQLGNSGNTDFSRLQFGGTTSSFPALKRSGAGLISRLADDSADAAFTASTLTASSSAANTSAIASTGYSLTGSSAVSMVDLAGTWNTTGTPTAIKLNVTDTASNAASLLMDLGTGGGSFSSKFSVSKAGGVIASAGSATAVSYGTGQANTGIYSRSAGFLVLSANGTPRIDISGSQIIIGSGMGFTTTSNATTGSVAYFGAEAANVLSQNNGNNTQTFRLYGRYTDATNDFERFFITASGTAGAAVQLGTQKGATAGTARALELQTDGTTRLTISTSAINLGLTLVGAAGKSRIADTGTVTVVSTAQYTFGPTSSDLNGADIGIARSAAGKLVITDASTGAGSLVFRDAGNIEVGTTTGTKIGTGTTQKLGFFNATPVVQQNGTGETTGFTAGSGTAVNDDSTFTGNVGATAYRINDIVKALKNLGLLAQ